MIECDAGARESLLNRRGDAVGVAVGGDGNGPTIVELDQCGAYVLGDYVGFAPSGYLAVLYVPPSRRLRRAVLPFRRPTTTSTSAATLLHS